MHLFVRQDLDVIIFVLMIYYVNQMLVEIVKIFVNVQFFQKYVVLKMHQKVYDHIIIHIINNQMPNNLLIDHVRNLRLIHYNN
jgi:hypothetical protein